MTENKDESVKQRLDEIIFSLNYGFEKADDCDKAFSDLITFYEAEVKRRVELEKELAKWKEDYPCCSGSPDCFNNKTQVFVDKILGKDGDPEKREYLGVVIESLETDVECYKHYLNESKEKIAPLESKLTQANEELLKANAKIVELEEEKDIWANTVLGHHGSYRECGHFVNDIMSFCPTCSELSTANKKADSLNEKLAVAVQYFDKITKLYGCDNECWAWSFNLAKEALEKIK